MNKVYEMITNEIITALEENIIPWKRTWKNGLPQNYITEKNYRGINLFLLLIRSIKRNFNSPYWLTWNQIKKLGGSVRKDEKSSFVVFYKNSQKIEEVIIDGENLINIKDLWLLRYYNVWNLEQTIDIKNKEIFKTNSEINKCENLIINFKDSPVIENNIYYNPSYTPSNDSVLMPPINNFKSSENYYTALFHELIHSTGHEIRLNREGLKNINFGSESYCKEELIAEMGASFLCGLTGIINETINENKAYIKNWIEVLKNNKTFLISAACQAQTATDYILNKKEPL